MGITHEFWDRCIQPLQFIFSVSGFFGIVDFVI